ncbi:PA14 domain-containing protein [Lentzea indica]|nr:PA14 domain-containing protein [Lentzea indica]
MVGAPKVYQTGLAADGAFARDWGTNAPATGVPVDSFSLRATGDIVFPEAGSYKLRVLANDGIRVWIDDAIVMDDWINTTEKWREATVTSPSAGAVKKIRIEYYEDVNLSRLELHWTTPGGTQQIVPATSLKPKYALTTSKRKLQSHGYGDLVESHKFGENGLDAAFGQVTSTTISGVETKFSYEAAGSGYLRKTGKTMPNGAQTTYQHYGDTETRDNPCTAEVEAVNQGGLPKLTRMPAASDGTAREDERIVDASGRPVAEGGPGRWTCTRYDARDRTVEVKFPGNAAQGERVVTTNHAVNGDPLVSSVTDHNGTVTTKVDLLGRTVEYTDVHGVRTETKYDRAGRATSEKVNLPLNPVQAITYTHDDEGRPTSVSLDGTLLATPSYDAAGELKSVVYANGTSLAAVGKDNAGDITSVTWKTKAGAEIASTVTRIRGGRIIDESLGGFDANPGGANYLYDAVGRMTEAWVKGHVYKYDFTTAATGCPAGSVGNAGLNSNRLRLLDQTSAGTAETGYCYDSADRLLGTVGANAASNVKYDAKGNTTEYTVNGSTTHLTWDGAERNIGARSVGADPAAVAYQRDSTNRIIRRSTEQGDQQTVALYGYTADGDTADIVLGEDKKLLSRTISLPGGVLLTISGDDGATRSYDHPTVRGDLALTTDAAGNQVGELRHYTPFGEPLAANGAVDADAVPDNQPGQMDFGWLGQHQRHYEHAGALSLVQMGARPYSPLLGRFLSVDPVEGGSANDYDYVNGDPVNVTDIDGRCPPCLFLGVVGLRVGVPILARFAVRAAVRFVPRVVGAMSRGINRAAAWLAPRIYSAKKFVYNTVRNGFTRLSGWWKTHGIFRVHGAARAAIGGYKAGNKLGLPEAGKVGLAAAGFLGGLLRFKFRRRR